MSKQDDASLILKLYELRREPLMRDARQWFITEFSPNTVEEVRETMMGPHSAHVRMVISYWDMAAALVNNGAIDIKMFNDTNGEQFNVFSRLELLLPQLREAFGPHFLANLEKLIDDTPGGRERSAGTREFMAKLVEELRARRTTQTVS